MKLKDVKLETTDPMRWFKVIKGEDEGSFLQSPGYSPGTTLFLNQDNKYCTIEHSNYCVDLDTEGEHIDVEPLALEDYEAHHFSRVFYHMIRTYDKEKSHKVYQIVHRDSTVKVGSVVKANEDLWLVKHIGEDSIWLVKTDGTGKQLPYYSINSKQKITLVLDRNILETTDFNLIYNIRRNYSNYLPVETLKEIFDVMFDVKV
jgi:hypothetical protein